MAKPKSKKLIKAKSAENLSSEEEVTSAVLDKKKSISLVKLPGKISLYRRSLGRLVRRSVNTVDATQPDTELTSFTSNKGGLTPELGVEVVPFPTSNQISNNERSIQLTNEAGQIEEILDGDEAQGAWGGITDNSIITRPSTSNEIIQSTFTPRYTGTIRKNQPNYQPSTNAIKENKKTLDRVRRAVQFRDSEISFFTDPFNLFTEKTPRCPKRREEFDLISLANLTQASELNIDRRIADLSISDFPSSEERERINYENVRRRRAGIHRTPLDTESTANQGASIQHLDRTQAANPVHINVPIHIQQLPSNIQNPSAAGDHVQSPTPGNNREQRIEQSESSSSDHESSEEDRDPVWNQIFQGVPRERVVREMGDNMFQIQRMIRVAVSALPNAKNNRAQLLKFLKCADNEYTNFREHLANDFLLNIFLRGIIGKLDEPLFSIVSNSNPRSYPAFRKILVKGTTNLIRGRAVIESEAKALMQLNGEKALDYFYRMENLLNEYEIALQTEDLPANQKELILQMFKREILNWLPNGLQSPLNHIAKFQTFADFEEFKMFLLQEKEREENVAFIASRTFNQPVATPIVPAFNISVENDSLKYSKKIEELSDEIKFLKEQNKFNDEKMDRLKSEKMFKNMIEDMRRDTKNEIREAMRSQARYPQQNARRNSSRDYIERNDLDQDWAEFKRFQNDQWKKSMQQERKTDLQPTGIYHNSFHRGNQQYQGYQRDRQRFGNYNMRGITQGYQQFNRTNGGPQQHYSQQKPFQQSQLNPNVPKYQPPHPDTKNTI